MTDYADALVDEVFYAALDTEQHAGKYATLSASVQLGSNGKQWDVEAYAPASSYLHPSVRMNWLLAKLETDYGMTFDFGSAQADIDTMIVPLINKTPNDITFNYGYQATIYQPSAWGGLANNYLRFTTVPPGSAIIASQSNPPEVSLECAIGFDGLLKFTVTGYMNRSDLRQIAYPIFKPKYGYRLDVNIEGVVQSVVILDEDTIITPEDWNASEDVYLNVTAYLRISMEAGDHLSMRITCMENGQADPDLPADGNPGIDIYTSNLYISEIVGDLKEVQPGQQYPVEGNLPDIKPIDLLKFLCVVTGTFPNQASTHDTLVMKPMTDVFDYSRAVDWTERLLSPTERPIAEQKEFHMDGWARQNWWRWKEDETVTGEYDADIVVDDETIDETRDILTFPFAATDGNNVPMYVTEDGTTKWHKVEPRVLRMVEGDSNEAVGTFDMDMENIIMAYYYDLAATMQHPAVIVENIRMDDVTFAAIDETQPIYIAQHGAYFALLSLELHGNGIAKATLLKLKKQEEIE